MNSNFRLVHKRRVRICVTCGKEFSGGSTAKYCVEHKVLGFEWVTMQKRLIKGKENGNT